MAEPNIIPEAQLLDVAKQVAAIADKLDSLSKTLDERTLKAVETSIGERQNQTPRLQGLLTSFRMWTTGIATVAIGFLQESGIDLDDQQKQYLSLAIMAVAGVLIYSDTHRKIGT